MNAPGHNSTGSPLGQNRDDLLRLLIIWLAAVATVVTVTVPHTQSSGYVYLVPAVIVAAGAVELARRRKAKIVSAQGFPSETNRSGRTWMLKAAPYIAFTALLVGVVLVAILGGWLPVAASALLITGLVIGVSPDYLGHTESRRTA